MMFVEERCEPVYAIAIENPETGAFVVGIKQDGSVEFGIGVTPAGAAAEFWKALEPLVLETFVRHVGS